MNSNMNAPNVSWTNTYNASWISSTPISNSDEESVSTFFDSRTFLGLYFYTYALVVVSMIFMSIIRGKRITLCHECYTFLKNVGISLRNIQILLNYSQEKCNIEQLSKTNPQYMKDDKNVRKKREKLSFLTYDKVSKFIDNEMAKIHGLVDNIGVILKSKAKKWLDADGMDPQQKEKQTQSVGQTLESKSQKQREDVKLTVTEQTEKKDDVTKTTNIEQEMYEYLQVGTHVENNNVNDTTNEKDEYFDLMVLINERLDKQVGAKNILKSLWGLRGLLWTGAAHYFDIATDIALIWEWYLIYQSGSDSDENDDRGPSMFVLFVCALATTIYYRLTSMYYVWKFTRSYSEGIFQFVFDHYLIKMIYVNIFEMNRDKPLELIKLLRGFEGGHESAFQSVLSLVFLFKINFQGNYAGILTLISFVFSYLSLINRFVSLDYYSIDIKAREFIANNISIDFEDVYNPKRWNILCKYKLNGWYLFHIFFRIVDVFTNVLFLVLFWVYIGGEYVAAMVIMTALGYLVLDYLYSRVSSLPTDWFRRILVKSIIYENKGTPFFNYGLFLVQFGIMMRLFIDRLLNGNNNKSDDLVWFYIWFSVCIVSVLCVIIARKNYAIWDYVTHFDYFSVAVADASNVEMELNLCDFIDMKNKDCIMFSKYLLGNSIFNNKSICCCCSYCCDQNKSLKLQVVNCVYPGIAHIKWGKDYRVSTLLCGDNEIYSMIEEWYYEYNTNKENFNEFLMVNMDNKKVISIICQVKRYRNNVINIYNELHNNRNININFNDIDNGDEWGGTILHWVCRYPNYLVVKWIIENNIIENINHQAKNGQNALCWLMYAVRSNRNLKSKQDLVDCEETKIGKLLISAGADEKEAKQALEQSNREEINSEWYQVLTGRNSQ